MDSKKLENSVLKEDEISNYVLYLFENLKKEITKNNLVIFHTNNKFLLMAHSQEKLSVLGNIVANHQKKSLNESIIDYETNLKKALCITPTIKQHINVIMHIFGYFSKDFDHLQKYSFLNSLEQFRNEKISLGALLWEIEPLVYQYNKTYLIGQTYFSLYAEKRYEISNTLLKP
jgi:uncharacterized protein YbgA (DUF1722 family)